MPNAWEKEADYAGWADPGWIELVGLPMRSEQKGEFRGPRWAIVAHKLSMAAYPSGSTKKREALLRKLVADPEARARFMSYVELLGGRAPTADELDTLILK